MNNKQFKGEICSSFMYEDNIVEAIKDGQIVKVPRMQAEEEDLFVLRKPGMIESRGSVEEKWVDLSSKRLPQTHYGVDLKNKVAKSLIDNFHWKIMRVRREKGLNRKQVAQAIGESEESIKKIEYGELISDDYILVTKLENYLNISLRKDSAGFDSARKLIDAKKVEERVAEDKKKFIRKVENSDAQSLIGNDIDLEGF